MLIWAWMRITHTTELLLLLQEKLHADETEEERVEVLHTPRQICLAVVF